MSQKRRAGIIVACIISIIVIVGTAASCTIFSCVRLYTLTTNINPSGAGSVSPLSGEYQPDTQVTLTASPASGYIFAHWSGDVSGTTPTITITMDSDKTLTANFEEAFALSVGVSPSGAGTVSPSDGEYESGAQVVLTASPASGHLFDHWSGDATGMSSSIIINMNTNKDVTAHFRIFFSPTFSHICEGLGIPQTTAYQGNEHPVVLLDSTGNKHDWSDELPIEWLPTVVEETQLVVCVEEEREIEIETCHYHNGPDITRYRYSLDVELREAKTGNIVAVTTLDGTWPRDCRPTEPYSLTRLEGSHVSLDQVQEWLGEYV
jgi:uncharacterized repeat protein (TIGR02543 family)